MKSALSSHKCFKARNNFRIVFVGMHNRPGLKPLDSKTRSGKLIDRVILALQSELNFGCDFFKTNLYDQEFWPKKNLSQTFEWAKRVEYTGNDVVITLGECVHEVFKFSNIEYIKLGHPSAVWSHEKQSEYITRAVGAVRKKINKK